MKRIYDTIRWFFTDLKDCFGYMSYITRYRWVVTHEMVENMRKFDQVPIELRKKFLDTVKFDKIEHDEYRETLNKLAKLIESTPNIENPKRININGIPRLYNLIGKS